MHLQTIRSWSVCICMVSMYLIKFLFKSNPMSTCNCHQHSHFVYLRFRDVEIQPAWRVEMGRLVTPVERQALGRYLPHRYQPSRHNPGIHLRELARTPLSFLYNTYTQTHYNHEAAHHRICSPRHGLGRLPLRQLRGGDLRRLALRSWR